MGDNKEKVFKVLVELGKPARPGEIAEAAGLSKEKVSKAIKELKKEGKITSPQAVLLRPGTIKAGERLNDKGDV